ncbi:MAG: Flp pilus assembly protein CpaB [Maritimibacter sp.]|nr:Flp pilus assembly protein CpaB [Maritimibacter sp.]
MNVKSLITILLGTTLAGGASYLVMTYSDTGAGAAEATVVPMQDILVAETEIAFGEAIEPRMFSVKSWPANALPPGAILDKAALFQGDEPRRALGHIYPGEPILSAKLSKPGERVTIVQKLTPGYRAMALRVNAETAVGGFVTPGDYVDVVLTLGGGEGLRALTVMQKVRVIGVDQVAEENLNQPILARTVTVEVTPEDGQKLVLAQQAGQLSLTLRDLEAPDLEIIPEIGLSDLFAPEPEPDPVPLAEPEVVVVEVPAEVVPEPEPEPVVDTRPRVIVRRGIVAEEVVVK